MGGRGGGAGFGSFGMTLRRLVTGDSSTAADASVPEPCWTGLAALARFLGVAACTTASTAGFGILVLVVAGISTDG